MNTEQLLNKARKRVRESNIPETITELSRATHGFTTDNTAVGHVAIYESADSERLKTDLAAAIRLGLSGDTNSLELLARRSTQRYKMRDQMKPIFDEFPAAKGSPLRESSLTPENNHEVIE